MPPRLNIPPVTRILLILLLLQSLLRFAIRYRQWPENSADSTPYLDVIPQLALIYPWTFLTATLVENNVVTLGLAGLALFHGGRYLERAWSSTEYAKFLAIVSLIPNILCVGVLILLFALTGDDGWILTPVGGTIALQISFLVAFSQLIPAHTVTLFRGVLSLRVPRFPLLYLGLVTILSLTPLLSGSSVFLAVFGFLTSWTYLRFYKTVFPDLDSSQPTTLRGDASETFAFAEFFPGPVKPFVAAFADQVFNVMVAAKICAPFSAADVSTARGDNVQVQRGAPGSARAEAERRRALALKALDQRLHAATANAAARAQTQPPQPSGPTVQSQPQPSIQNAMTTQPSTVLGETSYVPDQDGNEKEGA